MPIAQLFTMRSKIMLFAFLLILMSKVSTAVSQTCSEVFGPDPRFQSARLLVAITSLERSQGTPVIRDAAAVKDSGFHAFFSKERRSVTMDPRNAVIDQLIQFHHEAVHSTTDHKVRFDSANPSNALAIIVQRTGANIDESLPEGYKNYFQIDEMKAYRKTALFAAQIGRQFRSDNDVRAEKVQALSLNTMTASHIFASEAKKILGQARSVIQDAIQGGPIEFKAYLYAEDTPNVFNVYLNLPQQSGPPVVVQIPFYDPTAVNGNVDGVYRKLLAVVENGEAISTNYLAAVPLK